MHDARRPSRTRLLTGVAVFVVPIVVLEVMVRFMVGTGRLPAAPSHDEQFDVMWSTLEAAGPADVLLLGDSMTHTGIDPEVIEGRVEATLGRRPVVLNASSLGATSGLHSRVVQWLDREGRLPKVAVLPISPVSLREADVYREHFRFSALSSMQDGCPAGLGYQGWTNCHIDRVSALWRWRGDPRRLGKGGLAALQRGPGGVRPADVRPDGFAMRQPASSRSLAEQLQVAVAQSERDVVTLPAAVVTEYRKLATTLRSRGVDVVAVPVPFSPMLAEALDRRFPGWQTRWVAHANQLAHAAQIPMSATYSFGEWWSVGAAQDVNHLAEDGAREFTDQLWRDVAFRTTILNGLHSHGGSGP